MYNPGIGRFLSVDPLTKSYPWYTPYQFAGNKVIWAVDLDGLEERKMTGTEEFILEQEARMWNWITHTDAAKLSLYTARELNVALHFGYNTTYRSGDATYQNYIDYGAGYALGPEGNIAVYTSLGTGNSNSQETNSFVGAIWGIGLEVGVTPRRDLRVLGGDASITGTGGGWFWEADGFVVTPKGEEAPATYGLEGGIGSGIFMGSIDASAEIYIASPKDYHNAVTNMKHAMSFVEHVEEMGGIAEISYYENQIRDEKDNLTGLSYYGEVLYGTGKGSGTRRFDIMKYDMLGKGTFATKIAQKNIDSYEKKIQR
ncbi:hypothetical protein GCM10023331_41190 [Algivirga pacifica]|uniref:RHS repeat-associated core domain-containing protein n=1 Tax=Algivirga pacifica TaxID=1162670 RepID=A0ABP9DU31_9BACT